MPVDVPLAHLSDHLFSVAVVVYTLAMLAYAAEFAFSRTGRMSTRAAVVAPVVVEERVDDLVLVGAGAASSPPRAGGALPASAGYVEDDSAAAAAVAAAPAGGRGALIGRAAVVLTVLGWAVQVGSVTTRGLAAHRVPWGNMYEFSSMITLIAVTTYLVLLLRGRSIQWLGAFLLFPVVLYMGVAGTLLYVKDGPLQPVLNSYWLKIHVVSAIVSSGMFMVSGVITILYLVKERYERRPAVVPAAADGSGAAPEGSGGGVMRRLPSAEVLDRTAYRVIAFAFPLWTFAIIAGAIWAEAAWSRYWGWDPKETWSFITWVGYAAYLHARATAGWKGRRAATLSLIAFSALLVDYYLVNTVISGLHSYSGLPH